MKIEEEREYCLNCINKPCKNLGCPLENDIPNFIHEKDEEKAFELLCNTTVLPAVCGRICPKSRYCQGNCIRRFRGNPVEIGKIEAYIGDTAIEKNFKIPKFQQLNIEEIKKHQNNDESESSNTEKISEKSKIEENIPLEKNIINLENKKVAVVGAGPAGLTCSAFLAMQGVQVTIYEKNKNLGGLLTYGIPEFRLEKSIVKKSIDKILELGIKVKTESELGKNISLQSLLKEYDAVFLALGAGNPKRALKGENVLSGNELLEEIAKIGEETKREKFEFKNKECKKQNIAELIKKADEKSNNINSSKELNKISIPDFKEKSVIVYGGGNVAMDTARTLIRLGAKVTIVYRRNIEQMPAEAKEIQDAQNEGAKILENASIISFENNAANCVKTRLVQLDKETNICKESKNSKQKIEENENLTINNSKLEINAEKAKSNLAIDLKVSENQKKLKDEKFKILSEKQAERQSTKIENIEGSNFEINADYVALAIGSSAKTEFLNSLGIETNERGFAKINEKRQTSIQNVYAGGDLIGEEATVANAARSGREAAKAIISSFIENKKM